jgi:hypothetical protein
MRDDPKAPTAPLADFLAAYEKDDNEWWGIGCGHHQNLFEAAVDEVVRLTVETEQLRQLLVKAGIALEAESARVRAVRYLVADHPRCLHHAIKASAIRAAIGDDEIDGVKP